MAAYSLVHDISCLPHVFWRDQEVESRARALKVHGSDVDETSLFFCFFFRGEGLVTTFYRVNKGSQSTLPFNLEVTCYSNLNSKAAPKFLLLTLMKQPVHVSKVGHQFARKINCSQRVFCLSSPLFPPDLAGIT